jgi:hypothetical protein
MDQLKALMTIQNALAKLRRRNVKFSTLKVALTHNALPSSNGWSNLERKYAELQIPAMTATNYTSKLEKIYRDNLNWGDKAVQFAVFDASSKRMLEAAAAHRFVFEFVPSVPFPAPVTDDDLGRLTLRPMLVAAEANDTRTGATLYFYSRAYETEKETFPVEDMRDDISRSRFAGFDQVVAYKRLIFQRVDSVYIDSRSLRIEFRVDATRLATSDRMIEALKELKSCFRDVMRTQVDESWQAVSFHLTNFFPKIDQMYNDTTGTLVELGHNTAAGAINHGRMSGLKGDMKDDPSHLASMAASTTEKFAIRKAFAYFSNLSTVHLSIPGKSADTGSATPTVNTAIVEDCIEGQQFEDMMQILR